MLRTRLDQMDSLALTPVERYETFAEQGVTLRLTTPELASARVRRAEASGIELLVPGLGGRGVYVLEWTTALRRVQPTLHDHQLWPQLAGIRRVTPASVRGVARAVAALGSAGRDAAAAALAAQDALAQARIEARGRIEAALGHTARPPDAEARLNRLAELLAEVGAGDTNGALLQARISGMERLATEALALSAQLPDGGERTAATVIGAGARITLSALPCCLMPLRAAIAALPSVFNARDTALANLETLVDRLEFLMDGWPGLVALWDAVPLAERASILGDLVAALPVPAREAAAWSRHLAAWDGLAAARRRVPVRSIGRVNSVALNETVLARVA